MKKPNEGGLKSRNQMTRKGPEKFKNMKRKKGDSRLNGRERKQRQKQEQEKQLTLLLLLSRILTNQRPQLCVFVMQPKTRS